MKRVNRNILASGETTGHAHRAVGTKVEVFAEAYIEGGCLLHAPQGAVITHEEHKLITIPIGDFHTDQILEVDHFEQVIRRVQD